MSNVIMICILAMQMKPPKRQSRYGSRTRPCMFLNSGSHTYTPTVATMNTQEISIPAQLKYLVVIIRNRNMIREIISVKIGKLF